MDKSKRNKNAGKHPSYKKRGLSDKTIAKKRAYDKEFAAKDSAKKNRAECNTARRRAKAEGKDIEGKDASHTSRGIVFKSTAANRGSKRDSAGDRRARGGRG